MTPWRSRISLGDLIAAAKRLEADAETTRSIAELLGIARVGRPAPHVGARGEARPRSRPGSPRDDARRGRDG